MNALAIELLQFVVQPAAIPAFRAGTSMYATSSIFSAVRCEQ
jgi:hypothetical protein